MHGSPAVLLPSAIDIRDLTFGYAHQPIFSDFHFTTRSRLTVVRGPSGCGKTTLLKLIDGVLSGGPRATIERPAPIFLILQSDGLAPWLTGRENVELFSEELWARLRASPLFDTLASFVERPAHTLSFGQRRSIELTRALISGHPLLLLDEPLNFLDRVRRVAFIDYMRDPASCRSQIVMTSHYEDLGVSPDAETFEFSGDPPYSALVRA